MDPLSAVLKSRGIRYERDAHTAADQRMTWYAKDGTALGRFTAHEGWEWIEAARKRENDIHDAALAKLMEIP